MLLIRDMVQLLETALIENIKTTYPYETSPTVARHQCTECGGWARSDEGPIRHSKRCDSREQPALTPPTNPRDLAKFSAKVKKYGMTKGNDQDVVDAVRTGHLSVSQAMNTDD
jgi:hypothetical protein